MKLKSIVLASSAVVLTLSINAAFANDLVTNNNTTSYYSTVTVNGQCVSKVAPTQFTGPGQSLTTPWGIVKMLCEFKFPCTAEMYLATNKSDVINCVSSADSKATVTLNADGSVVASGVPQNAAVNLVGGSYVLNINNR